MNRASSLFFYVEKDYCFTTLFDTLPLAKVTVRLYTPEAQDERSREALSSPTVWRTNRLPARS